MVEKDMMLVAAVIVGRSDELSSTWPWRHVDMRSTDQSSLSKRTRTHLGRRPRPCQERHMISVR